MRELDDINIRHFKLTTGEDLIAIILTEEEIGSEHFRKDLITVQSPMEIRMMRSDTEVSFIFYEWQPLAKSNVCFINPIHVVSHVECSNDVKGQYINACVNTPTEHDEGPSNGTYDEPPIYGPSSETYH